MYSPEAYRRNTSTAELNMEICDNIVNAAASLLMRVNPLLNIQSATLDSSLLSHNPMESIHIHHNAAHHFVTTSSFGGKVILYDSMNIAPTNQLKEQITAIYSPDNTIPGGKNNR